MATVPQGIRPLYVSNKQKEKYGLGDGISHKLFNKQEAINDAQSMGFYSIFHELKNDLLSYSGEEVLVVADTTGQYGENFYACLSEATKNDVLQKLTSRPGSAVGTGSNDGDAAAAALAEAEAKRRGEEEAEAALQSIVVHEEPRPVRPYTSETAQQTAEEVRELTVRRSRPQIQLRIQRRRYAFGATYSFNDRESEAAVAEFRSRKEPAYELKRKELTIGLQACPSALAGRKDGSTQTAYYPPVNSVIQCDMEAETIAMASTAPLATVLSRVDVETSSIAVGTDIDDEQLDQILGGESGKVDHAALRPLIAEAVASAAAIETGTSADNSAAGVGVGRAPMGMQTGLRASSLGMPAGAGKIVATPLEKLVDFLHRALPQCEHALSQNETLNIFHNELTLLADEDIVVMGNSDAKHIREERQFMDLELTNGKILSAIEWHPKSATWLAVAAIPKLTFEQRVTESAIPRASFILLYTLAEFSNQLVLEAPADVTCMSWNPGNPNFLAVGTINGYVAVFDMSEAHEAINARRHGSSEDDDGVGSSEQSGAGEGQEEGSDVGPTSKALHLKPKFVSAVEASGNRAVVGIHWLPVEFHLNHRNSFAEDRDGEVSQFISATADGAIAVWDIRFKERSRGRRRASVTDGTSKDASVLQSSLVPGAAAANVPAPPPEMPWLPTYRVNVRFGAGLVNFTAFVFNEKLPSEPVVCGTEEGRIVVVDWAPPGEGTGADAWLRGGEAAPRGQEQSPRDGDHQQTAAKTANIDGEGESAGSAMRVIWIAQDGERPPAAMQRSPFFHDIFLVVTDFSFSLWKRGIRSPVLVSSPAVAKLTSARWSPSRPGVIYIGRVDGVLEVWDLLDSTIKPAVTLTLMSVPVTSMEFRSTSGANPAHTKQLLAVGDAKGSLHVLDVPLPLRKGAPNEEALVTAHLDREVARVSYYSGRQAFHEAEKSKTDAEAQRLTALKEANASKLESEFQAALAQLAEADPVAAKTFDVAALERQKQRQALVAAEERYKALEKSIMAELNISDADIVPMAIAPSSASPDVTTAEDALKSIAESSDASTSALLAKKLVSGSGAAAAKNLAASTSKGGAISSAPGKGFRSPLRMDEGKRPR